MFFRPLGGDSLDVLVVLHGVAGMQRLVASARRKNIQLSMMGLLLLMCLCLYPAACLLLLLLWLLVYLGKQKVKLNPQPK